MIEITLFELGKPCFSDCHKNHALYVQGNGMHEIDETFFKCIFWVRHCLLWVKASILWIVAMKIMLLTFTARAWEFATSSLFFFFDSKYSANLLTFCKCCSRMPAIWSRLKGGWGSSHREKGVTKRTFLRYSVQQKFRWSACYRQESSVELDWCWKAFSSWKYSV